MIPLFKTCHIIVPVSWGPLSRITNMTSRFIADKKSFTYQQTMEKKNDLRIIWSHFPMISPWWCAQWIFNTWTTTLILSKFIKWISEQYGTFTVLCLTDGLVFMCYSRDCSQNVYPRNRAAPDEASFDYINHNAASGLPDYKPWLMDTIITSDHTIGSLIGWLHNKTVDR